MLDSTTTTAPAPKRMPTAEKGAALDALVGRRVRLVVRGHLHAPFFLVNLCGELGPSDGGVFIVHGDAGAGFASFKPEHLERLHIGESPPRIELRLLNGRKPPRIRR